MKFRQGFVSNSSTSSFICNTDKDKKEVESTLRSIWRIYKTGKNSHYSVEDDTRCFEDVFQIKEVDENYVERFSVYGVDKHDIGKLTIESTTDNAIDYALWPIIEDEFDATRFHFG